MLMPKKVKHRKWQKGRRRSASTESRGTELAFGSFGLQSEDTQWVTSRQLEAARRASIRYLQKGGKLWIRVFPDRPVTTKGTEVGMGGGKGSVDHYVYNVRPGRIILEIDGVTRTTALEALRLASHKLPVRTRIVAREE